MPVYYLDTSAVIKLYIYEHGTEVMDRLLDEAGSNDSLYTSWLTMLEFTSVISRLAKGDRLEADDAASILGRFRQQIEDSLLLWPIDTSVLTAALSIISRHALRSPDAIHLATASLIFRQAPQEQRLLVSSDRELLEAAVDSGVEVLDPQNPT